MLSGVSKTALLTLRARADEHRMRDRLFADPHAVEWFAQAGWPKELDRWYSSWSQAKTAFRADQIDWILRKVLAEKQRATVIELGAGLSSRYYRCGQSENIRWLDLDLLEVIELRERLSINGKNHEHLAFSVLDRTWLEAIQPIVPEETVLIAEGLFYYLPKSEVEALFVDLRRQLAGATIIFDIIGMVDIDASRAASTAAGAPILWAADPPFERAWDNFGLQTIPGLEPEVLVEEMIARFQKKYGKPMRWVLQALVSSKKIRERRSGVMVGELRPPDR